MNLRELFSDKSPCKLCIVKPVCKHGMDCPKAIHYLLVLQRRDAWEKKWYPVFKHCFYVAVICILILTGALIDNIK